MLAITTRYSPVWLRNWSRIESSRTFIRGRGIYGRHPTPKSIGAHAKDGRQRRRRPYPELDELRQGRTRIGERTILTGENSPLEGIWGMLRMTNTCPGTAVAARPVERAHADGTAVADLLIHHRAAVVHRARSVRSRGRQEAHAIRGRARRTAAATTSRKSPWGPLCCGSDPGRARPRSQCQSAYVELRT